MPVEKYTKGGQRSSAGADLQCERAWRRAAALYAREGAVSTLTRPWRFRSRVAGALCKRPLTDFLEQCRVRCKRPLPDNCRRFWRTAAKRPHFKTATVRDPISVGRLTEKGSMADCIAAKKRYTRMYNAPLADPWRCLDQLRSDITPSPRRSPLRHQPLALLAIVLKRPRLVADIHGNRRTAVSGWHGPRTYSKTLAEYMHPLVALTPSKSNTSRV